MMSRRAVYRLSGYLSIVNGIAAALCIFQIRFMTLGIFLAITGFVFSGINIWLNTKYYYEEETYPKGYLGMLLSSLPVLFMLFVIFKFRQS